MLLPHMRLAANLGASLALREVHRLHLDQITFVTFRSLPRSGVQQYNAVPPPSAGAAPAGGALPPPPGMTREAVAVAARAAQQRRAPGVAKPFTIQPQMAKKKAAGPAHNAFAPAASPAYTKVCAIS